MTAERADHDEVARLLQSEPESLSREELIELVHGLRQLVARRADPAVAPAPARPPARAVPGADFTLVFDGGSLGNPGLGYGSYEIVAPGGSVTRRQIEFGDGMTNNQAEFRAVIAGLEDLLQRVGPDARSLTIAVRGDSQLVIRGLNGEWRVKHPGLQPLHQQALALLGKFRATDLAWHPRRESVRSFGH